MDEVHVRKLLREAAQAQLERDAAVEEMLRLRGKVQLLEGEVARLQEVVRSGSSNSSSNSNNREEGGGGRERRYGER